MPYTVRQGGKSAGSARHTHPLWVTYRIASTTARRQCDVTAHRTGDSYYSVDSGEPLFTQTALPYLG